MKEKTAATKDKLRQIIVTKCKQARFKVIKDDACKAILKFVENHEEQEQALKQLIEFIKNDASTHLLCIFNC